MKERVKCPRCGVEYDMLNEGASKAMNWLCAACWCDWHENNIGVGGELGSQKKERKTTKYKNIKNIK